MHIGLIVAVLAGIGVHVMFGPLWGTVAGIAVFALWYGIRRLRRRRRVGGDVGPGPGSHDASGSPSSADHTTSGSSASGGHGSFIGGGGAFGGAGAAGFWASVFDQPGGGGAGSDGGGHGGGDGGGGGNGGGGNGGSGGH